MSFTDKWIQGTNLEPNSKTSIIDDKNSVSAFISPKVKVLSPHLKISKEFSVSIFTRSFLGNEAFEKTAPGYVYA